MRRARAWAPGLTRRRARPYDHQGRPPPANLAIAAISPPSADPRFGAPSPESWLRIEGSPTARHLGPLPDRVIVGGDAARCHVILADTLDVPAVAVVLSRVPGQSFRLDFPSATPHPCRILDAAGAPRRGTPGERLHPGESLEVSGTGRSPRLTLCGPPGAPPAPDEAWTPEALPSRRQAPQVPPPAAPEAPPTPVPASTRLLVGFALAALASLLGFLALALVLIRWL